MQKNRIELAGYLVAKPEGRFLPSGTKVANARLKESSHFTGTDGKQQTHANWHSLVFYGELADVALSYDKDDNIYVEGSPSSESSLPHGWGRDVLLDAGFPCGVLRSFPDHLGRDRFVGAPAVVSAREQTRLGTHGRKRICS